MLKITFSELLEAAGSSITSKSDPTFNQASANVRNVLTIDAVRGATERQLRIEYASNKLGNLLYGISDATFVAHISKFFDVYVANLGNAATFNHPSKAKLDLVSQDALTKLLTDIATYTKTAGSAISSQTRSQFLTNTNRFIITISSEEEREMSENELQILGYAGLKSPIVVPQSAVLTTSPQYASLYAKQPFPTFTGVDMQVIFMTNYSISYNITLKVLTYSKHAGLIPIPVLGRKRAKGFAQGNGNIAGTMIATVTINEPLMDLQPLLHGVEDYAKSANDVWKTYLLPDQLPLFDILCVFSNEAGFVSVMPIFGVQITDDGSVMSMSDSEIEVTYTYQALDIDILRSTNTANGTVDILSNNEYLARRKRAYDGKSRHRDIYEIGSVYQAIDNRVREFQYDKLRMAGISLGSLVRRTE